MSDNVPELQNKKPFTVRKFGICGAIVCFGIAIFYLFEAKLISSFVCLIAGLGFVFGFKTEPKD